MKKYKLLKDRFDVKAGTIVYEYEGHDYGVARDDSYYTGVYHTSVTLNEDGATPFFTVPEDDLEQL
jgi:hypothetical protein